MFFLVKKGRFYKKFVFIKKNWSSVKQTWGRIILFSIEIWDSIYYQSTYLLKMDSTRLIRVRPTFIKVQRQLTLVGIKAHSYITFGTSIEWNDHALWFDLMRSSIRWNRNLFYKPIFILDYIRLGITSLFWNFRY